MKQNAVGIAMLMIALSGCTGSDPAVRHRDGILRIKGSDSMVLLLQSWAAEFMSKHPDISVYTEGGGTGDGIKALIDGSIDIAAGSRPMNAEEIRNLAERYRSVGLSLLTARDALSIIVHPDNPVSQLSGDQIKKIFTGEIVSWKEVGGMDAPVTVYSREPNSGTFVFFEEHILLGKEFTPNYRTKAGAQALVHAVAGDVTGIGYTASAYVRGVKSIDIDGISAAPENVRNGTYPVSRYFYLYSVHQPEGEIKQFFDWVLSEEGQGVVKRNGYITLYDIP